VDFAGYPRIEGAAVVIACPNCAHRLNLKAAKPGRFRPKCPGCDRPFLLIVPDNGDEPEARALLDETMVVPSNSGLIPGKSGALPVAGKSGALPGSSGSPAKSGRIPGNSGTMPGNVGAQAGNSGTMPGQNVRKSGNSGTMPGQSRMLPSSANPLGLEETALPVAAPKLEMPSSTQIGAAPLPESQAPVVAASAKPAPQSIPEATPRPKPARDITLKPKTVVRGYELERELGRGGMGSVYLARQLSLDRHVALKVMSNRWAADPVFVARFTREAYASAQLSHPNIVQIHDIGEVAGTRFFSMEYVRGRSLADLVKSQGKIDPETAVGYILQAARGLKHAHDRGMIHRDVKPDNLLLGEQGIVKVADLGLVKTPTTSRGDDRLDESSHSGQPAEPAQMTGAKIALGTPAYMSPEQCRDAATVDHRADIYSLGCTLYVLVTGRPPFDGTTAMELMSKHAYDPLVPPEQIVARVPKEVSAVIQRMMEKNAEDRFQSMDEVIRTLESWLGVSRVGDFSPREEQITQLEGFVEQFNSAPAAVLRGRVLKGFFAVTAIGVVLLTFFGRPSWAFGLIGLTIQASLAYFIIDGIARRGFLFGRARQFLFGLSWGDWVVGVSGLALFCVMLAMLDQFWIWAGFGIAAIMLAFALRYALDRKVERQRRPQIDASERLLRRLRMQGLDEDEIGQFIAKYAGRDWEEFYEALFGYEAKLHARALLLRGGSAGVREKHAAWREPLLALMDRIEKARKAAREQRLLAAVERANLLAAGVTPEAAEDKAKATAEAMVKAAVHVREVEVKRGWVSSGARDGTGGAPVAPPAPVNVRMAVMAPQENQFAPPEPRRDVLGPLIKLFVGPHIRAIGAIILLGGCALWIQQNGLMPGADVQNQVVDQRDLTTLQDTAAETLRKQTKPLVIDGVPSFATSWIDSWNTGVAGLLLLASLFYRGNVMSIFAILGAAIAAIGHQYGIQAVEPFRDQHIGLMLGSVLAFVGFRLGR